ncbi:MAG TPA: ATP synthase subunit I [Gammaproteobacteria bacterium]|nr:ATP synthase subunit I [Gammaproteobacteria bacterium]
MDIDKPVGRIAPGALYKYSRGIVLRVVAGQIVVALLAALALTLILGSRFGYSALVGAGIGIVPTYYLAVRLFKHVPSMSPEKALRGIYLGEGLKIVFTVALFFLAMLLLDIDLLVVALVYLGTVGVNWVAVFFADLGESPRGNA